MRGLSSIDTTYSSHPSNSGAIQCSIHTALPFVPPTAVTLPQTQRLRTTTTISGVLQCLQHMTLPPASLYEHYAWSHRNRVFTTSTISGNLHCLQHTTLPPASPKDESLATRQRLFPTSTFQVSCSACNTPLYIQLLRRMATPCCKDKAVYDILEF